MATAPEYQNIYGRKWGRGLRPYLLIPKFIFVAGFLGGLITLLVLGFLGPAPKTAAEWARDAEFIRQSYVRVIIPALVATLLAGAALAAAHLPVFLRMRWLQLKLGLIVVLAPTLHLFMSGRSLAVRRAVADGDFVNARLIREQLFHGTWIALVFALAVILLGRLKPRLGQNYARSFSRSKTDAQS
jgi:hypothetical protein